MKTIEKRGRTMDALLNPRSYAPFSGINNQDDLHAVWHVNPDLIMAHMSHAAYFESDFLCELLQPLGASIKCYQSKAGPRGFIRGRRAFMAVWDDKAILSFRGTDASQKLKIKTDKQLIRAAQTLNITIPSEIKTLVATNYFDDVSIASVNHTDHGKTVQLHSGFYNATRELWPEISADLKALDLHDPTQIFATGHSLGGAMALVSGLMFPFKSIISFGAPTVGSQLEQLIDTDHHIRYVNGDDFVPKLIPKFLYQHHGVLKQIQDQDGSDFRFDHSIINYAEILKKRIPAI